MASQRSVQLPQAKKGPRRSVLLLFSLRFIYTILCLQFCSTAWIENRENVVASMKKTWLNLSLSLIPELCWYHSLIVCKWRRHQILSCSSEIIWVHLQNKNQLWNLFIIWLEHTLIKQKNWCDWFIMCRGYNNRAEQCIVVDWSILLQNHGILSTPLFKFLTSNWYNTMLVALMSDASITTSQIWILCVFTSHCNSTYVPTPAVSEIVDKSRIMWNKKIPNDDVWVWHEGFHFQEMQRKA